MQLGTVGEVTDKPFQTKPIPSNFVLKMDTPMSKAEEHVVMSWGN